MKSTTKIILSSSLHRSLVIRSLALLCIVLSALSLSACNEYWRTRGQPPSVNKLIERSQSRLSEARTGNEVGRIEVSAISKRLETSLLAAFSSLESIDANEDGDLLRSSENGNLLRSSENGNLLRSLGEATENFIALEGKVSIGSRAALGELSGQMRSFAERASKGDDIPRPAFGLFAARTMFFLANELTVPKPSFG